MKKIEYWICAVDVDSFNCVPKQIKESQVDEAIQEGFNIHSTIESCQKECDFENSL